MPGRSADAHDPLVLQELQALGDAGRACESIEADLARAKARIEQPGRLVRCMTHLQVTQAPALVLDRIRKLRPAAAPRCQG